MNKDSIKQMKKAIKEGLVSYMATKDPGKSSSTYNTYVSDSNYLLNNDCVSEFIEFVRSDTENIEMRELIKRILIEKRGIEKTTEKGVNYYYEKLCWQREYIRFIGGIDALLK